MYTSPMRISVAPSLRKPPTGEEMGISTGGLTYFSKPLSVAVGR